MNIFVKEDQLTYLPINEEGEVWNFDDKHNYDILVVVDGLNKLWAVPYTPWHPKAPLDAKQFYVWTKWLVTGIEPNRCNILVKEHQKIYEYTTAIGLVHKCIKYPEYGRALLKEIEMIFKESYKESCGMTMDEGIQHIRKVYEEGILHNDLLFEEKGKTWKLVEMIRVASPFNFVGIIANHGTTQYVREDCESSSETSMPKSDFKLDDKKLAESDFSGIDSSLHWLWDCNK